MEGIKIPNLYGLRTPLIGLILEYLEIKEITELNKSIQNKKIFTLTSQVRFKNEKINKIKQVEKLKEFETNFGLIVFRHLKTFDKNLIAVAGLSGGLEIINFKTNERSNEITIHSDTINSIVDFERDNINVLASSSYDHTIKFLDLKTREQVFTPITCDFIVYYMKIVSIKGEKYFLTATFQAYYLRSIHTMNSLFSVKLHGNYIYKVIQTKSLNPQCFLTSSYDNTIKYSNCIDSKVLSTLSSHTSAVWGLGYLKHYDKEMCVSGSWDHTIKIWNFVKEQLIRTIETDPNNTKHLSQFSFMNGKLFVMAFGGKISFYDLKQEKIVYEFEPHTTDIYWFAALKEDENNFCFISSSIDRKLIFHNILPS